MKALGQLICGFGPTAGARKRRLRWLLVLALITTGFALASPALATPPVTTRATVGGTAPGRLRPTRQQKIKRSILLGGLGV